jgi:hypothetical protein
VRLGSKSDDSCFLGQVFPTSRRDFGETRCAPIVAVIFAAT